VQSSDKLISHVGDFKDMNDQMVSDIEFAANVLGNSGEPTDPDHHTRTSNGTAIER
jgi:hypothetical protein